MECCRCDIELNESTIRHDYAGNEWCKECLEEETNRQTQVVEQEGCLGTTDKELFAFQRKTVTLINKKIRYHQMLYRITNHSKKKANHLKNVMFMQDVLKEAYDEYGW